MGLTIQSFPQNVNTDYFPNSIFSFFCFFFCTIIILLLRKKKFFNKKKQQKKLKIELGK